MRQIGQHLDAHGGPDALVLAAFALVLTGLLVKAAALPFHFWLPDAHAVAPTPVCMLLSGVMVELGVYGTWRVYDDGVRGAGRRAGAGRRTRPGGARRPDRPGRRADVLAAAPHQTPPRLLDRRAHRPLPGRHRPPEAAGVGRRGAVRPRPRGREGGPVRLHRDPARPLRQRGRARTARPGAGVAGGRPCCSRSARWPSRGFRPSARGSASRSRRRRRARGFTVLFVAVSALTGGAVLRVAARVFLGLGPRPLGDPGYETSGEGEEPETGAGSAGCRPRWSRCRPCCSPGRWPPGSSRVWPSAVGRSFDAGAPHAPHWTLPGVLLGLASTALAVGLAGRRCAGPARREPYAVDGAPAPAALRAHRRLRRLAARGHGPARRPGPAGHPHRLSGPLVPLPRDARNDGPSRALGARRGRHDAGPDHARVTWGRCHALRTPSGSAP